ncbi:GNAT family N-acetyltransferase [Rhodohalobacter sp.]|uniref:GNAT family N-acetyltransferase n=1 Tax=Rhodohalobacter sp. TaxID=1974210 RepID=UPI002AD8F72B|nr:hypothetical protein [Rhodohalobacter sp.]
MAEVKNNKEKNRYELSVDGKTAVAEYILNKQGVLFFTHTEVPDEFEGARCGIKINGRRFQGC